MTREIFSNRTLALPAIVFLGLALRLVQLDVQPLWWDEGYSVFFATRDVGTMLAHTAVDIHPPLYYALLQLWIGVFGQDASALRLLSVLIGVAAIPLLYLVARELFNPRVALLSAFLLAIAPLHIYYSQEVRMYGLVLLLGLASVYLQLLLLHSQFAIRNPQFILYVVVTALALYTQYLAAFLIAAQIAVVLYLKFRARWQMDLRAWAMAWIAIGALYLPWVIYAGPKLLVYVTAKVGIEQYTRLDPATYLAQHLTAFSTGHVSEWAWLQWGAILFIALAILGFLASRKYHVGEGNTQFAIRNSLSALYLFVPLALGFLVNLVYTFHPIRYERLLLFAAPFFFIYLACGILALLERDRGVGILASAAIVMLCALSLYDFYAVPRYPDEDYRPLIQEMETIATENDLVYALYPWQVGYLEAYYRGAKLNVRQVEGATWIKNPEEMNTALATLREKNPRAWILAYQKQGRILEDRLLNEYSNDDLILDQTVGNTRVVYFAQGNATDFELPAITFSPELTLRIQYAAFDPPAQPNLARARFTWNAANAQYAYSLRVVDSAGNKISQQDAPIPNGTTTLRRALTLPTNLAAGEYTLQLVAYRRADGSPLKQSTGATAIALAKISVTR